MTPFVSLSGSVSASPTNRQFPLFYRISVPLFKSQQNWSVLSTKGHALKQLNGAAFGLFAGVGLGLNPSLAKDITADVILKEMPVRERYAYVAGIVEGLAYARFRKDTIEAGSKVETGLQCIQNWFYADGTNRMLEIESAFADYPTYPPAALVAVMAKKECGE